jgi:hypothetical protein
VPSGLRSRGRDARVGVRRHELHQAVQRGRHQDRVGVHDQPEMTSRRPEPLIDGARVPDVRRVLNDLDGRIRGVEPRLTSVGRGVVHDDDLVRAVAFTGGQGGEAGAERSAGVPVHDDDRDVVYERTVDRRPASIKRRHAAPGRLVLASLPPDGVVRISSLEDSTASRMGRTRRGSRAGRPAPQGRRARVRTRVFPVSMVLWRHLALDACARLPTKFAT